MKSRALVMPFGLLCAAFIWSCQGQDSASLTPVGPDDPGVAAKPIVKRGKGGGGRSGNATAEVTISGTIQSYDTGPGGVQNLRVTKDSGRVLDLEGGSVTGGFPFRVRLGFTNTQDFYPYPQDLSAMLVDLDGYPPRWHIRIRIDVSDLEVGKPSTTGSNGHIIRVEDEDPETQEAMGLWIPGGSYGQNSPEITVALLDDSVSEIDGMRVRKYLFTFDTLSVGTGVGKSARTLHCTNNDGPIGVTVRTTP